MGSTIFRTLGHQEIFSSKHGLIFGQINATRDGENKIKAKSIVMEAANDELPNVGKPWQIGQQTPRLKQYTSVAVLDADDGACQSGQIYLPSSLEEHHRHASAGRSIDSVNVC